MWLRRRGLPCRPPCARAAAPTAGPCTSSTSPCVVAGVPCRYVHAGTAICRVDDVRAAAEVAVAVAERLTSEVLAGF